MSTMNFHRHFGNTEFARDLLIQETASYQRQYLSLARSQRRELSSEVSIGNFFCATFLIAFERLPHCIEKFLLAERLCKKVYCASLHSRHRHRNIAMTRNKDYRYYYS